MYLQCAIHPTVETRGLSCTTIVSIVLTIFRFCSIVIHCLFINIQKNPDKNRTAYPGRDSNPQIFASVVRRSIQLNYLSKIICGPNLIRTNVTSL